MRISLPVALAIALAAAAPVRAQVAFTDAEVAWFAAQWQQIDFAQEDKLCTGRKYARGLKAGREAFAQAHPEFATALAFDAASPAAAEVVARKLHDVQKLHDSLAQMMVFMPKDQVVQMCERIVDARAGTDFAQRIGQSRDLLARDKAPAPEEPLTTLAPHDVTPIVSAVLQHKDVAMYLHPDAPGRVPVRVALAAPYAEAAVQLELYGAPVRLADAGDRGAVQLILKPHGERVRVEVKYEPEGIFGSVDVERIEGAWKATGAQILE